MVESIRVENEGPDGTYLVIEDDQVEHYSGMPKYRLLDQAGKFRFRLSDEALRQLDRELQPWRDHMAEGEAVRREFTAQRASGRCSNWVPRQGPCQREADHSQECAV